MRVSWFLRNCGSIYPRSTFTDYGHTKAKSLILCSPNSNSNPRQIFGLSCFFVEIMAQFVSSSPKVLDFNKKRLHWASVVHATTYSGTTNPNCHHFITSHVILFVKSNLIHKKNCEIHTSYFRIWLLEP